MTAYYTATGNPPAATRGLSAQMRSEFNLIVAAFNAAQTDILNRAIKAGDTYTGTHDFSGATAIKVPTQLAGDNSTNAASTAFVVSTSLAASLPGVTGKAGNVITNDGVTVSWGSSLKASVIRFADGTDATKLLAFDVSAVTTGTTRTLTVPNKSGTIALLSDTGMTLLATLTPTAAANVDALSVFTGSYDNYLIVAEGIKPASDGTLQVRFANGGVVDTASNYLNQSGGATGVTTTAAFGSLNAVTAAGRGMNFSMSVLNANSAAGLKNYAATVASQSAATPAVDLLVQHCAYIGASAISGIRFFWGAGQNFAAVGTIRIYGYSS